MSNSEKPSIARRDFLRGVACLAGAGVVGAASASTSVGTAIGIGANKQVAPLPAAPGAVGFFDGSRLTSASSLTAGDPNLQTVQVTVTGFGAGITSVDLHSEVKGMGSRAPFHAWTAPPRGLPKSTVLFPITSQGLELSIQAGSTSTPYVLRSGTGTGPKLRTGTYVIASKPINWSVYELHSNTQDGALELTMGGAPVNFSYVLVVVQPA